MAVNTSVHTVTQNATGRGRTTTEGVSRRKNIGLWAGQGAFAALFLFAGAAKLFGSSEAISAEHDLPVLFMRFIGGAEVLGAIGLILPWALRIRPGLTPLAAAGLAIIMVGATVTTAITISLGLAAVDAVFFAALVAITYGRRDYAARTK